MRNRNSPAQKNTTCFHFRIVKTESVFLNSVAHTTLVFVFFREKITFYSVFVIRRSTVHDSANFENSSLCCYTVYTVKDCCHLDGYPHATVCMGTYLAALSFLQTSFLRAILIETENRQIDPIIDCSFLEQSMMYLFSFVPPKIGVHAFLFLSVFSVFGSNIPSRQE